MGHETSLPSDVRQRPHGAARDDLEAERQRRRDHLAQVADLQEHLRHPPARRMPFRIGVHLGDIMVEGERIYHVEPLDCEEVGESGRDAPTPSPAAQLFIKSARELVRPPAKRKRAPSEV